MLHNVSVRNWSRETLQVIVVQLFSDCCLLCVWGNLISLDFLSWVQIVFQRVKKWNILGFTNPAEILKWGISMWKIMTGSQKFSLDIIIFCFFKLKTYDLIPKAMLGWIFWKTAAVYYTRILFQTCVTLFSTPHLTVSQNHRITEW